MTIQNNFNRIGSSLKRHSPELLTAVGVAGLALTTYLASRAGYKSGLVVMAETSRRMDEVSEDDELKILTPREIVKETWRFYIPVAMVAVVTGVAIVGSNRVSRNREMALIGAAALADQLHREYRDKVIEHTTKPKEQKIRDDIAQDKVNEKKDEFDRLVLANPGDVLCIEMYTGRTFVSTAEKIHKAANEIGRQCLHDSYASHNDFMTKLGLPWVEAGEAVGWNNDNPLEVKIGGAAHETNDGRTEPVLTVGYAQQPRVGYASPWL